MSRMNGGSSDAGNNNGTSWKSGNNGYECEDNNQRKSGSTGYACGGWPWERDYMT